MSSPKAEQDTMIMSGMTSGTADAGPAEVR